MRVFRLTLLFAVFVVSSLPSDCQRYNARLIAQLDTILKTDQQYRGKASEVAAKKWGWDSRQVSALMNKQLKADLLNKAKVEKIITQYGYPGKTLVGEKHQATVFLVLQHNDNETQEKYFPLLKEAADKGELKWSSLALMIDRIKVGNDEQQIYGSQLSQEGDSVKLYPIEDEPNVNIRRVKIGLGPLQDYLKYFHIHYRLPTADSNFNSPSLYATKQAKTEFKSSPVELIGGVDSLYSKLIYPSEARKHNINGDVVLQLTIDKTGKPKDVMVVNKLGYGCDEEAVRVMNTARFTNTSNEDHEIRMRLPFPFRKQ